VGPGDEVLALAPRGVGRLAWRRRSPPNYVERAHALLGRTVDMGRVWDIQAVLRWWHEQDRAQRPLVVLGHRQGAVLAAYAALGEPAVHEVIAVAPTSTHRQGPYFLGILRVLDVPEALGLLAPRRLHLLGVEERDFRHTVALYRLADAADRLRLRP
jgi:alpha-beta hydrolase superfamily lysophospholipase